jgi:hypothetical protein
MISSTRIAASASLAISCILGVAPQADAGPLVLETFVGANLGCTQNVTCPGDDPLSFAIPGPIPGTGGSQGYGLVSFSTVFGPRFTGAAAADAGAGFMKVRASGTFNLTTAPAGTNHRFAVASAQVIDELIITAPGQSGQGLLNVSAFLDGVISTSGTGGALILVGVGHGGDVPFDQEMEFQAFSTSISGTISFGPIPFTYGQPFFLSTFMAAGAGTIAPCPSCGGLAIVPQNGIGSGNSDFFNTFVLSGLVPTDLNGNPVLNPQFSSGSGVQYSTTGVVPEPGSILLLGGGLTLLGYRLRRTKRQ